MEGGQAVTPVTLTLPDVEFASAGGSTTLTLGPAAVEALVDALASHLNSEDASPYLTITEAAEYLRAPRHRVDALLTSRKLKRRYDGRRPLIRRDELEAYIESQ